MSVCARSVSVCLRSLSLPRSRCVCRRPRLFLDSVSIALFPRLCVRSLSRPVLDSVSIALALSRLCARSLSLFLDSVCARSLFLDSVLIALALSRRLSVFARSLFLRAYLSSSSPTCGSICTFVPVKQVLLYQCLRVCAFLSVCAFCCAFWIRIDV